MFKIVSKVGCIYCQKSFSTVYLSTHLKLCAIKNPQIVLKPGEIVELKSTTHLVVPATCSSSLPLESTSALQTPSNGSSENVSSLVEKPNIKDEKFIMGTASICHNLNKNKDLLLPSSVGYYNSREFEDLWMYIAQCAREWGKISIKYHPRVKVRQKHNGDLSVIHCRPLKTMVLQAVDFDVDLKDNEIAKSILAYAKNPPLYGEYIVNKIVGHYCLIECMK